MIRSVNLSRTRCEPRAGLTITASHYFSLSLQARRKAIAWPSYDRAILSTTLSPIRQRTWPIPFSDGDRDLCSAADEVRGDYCARSFAGHTRKRAKKKTRVAMTMIRR